MKKFIRIVSLIFIVFLLASSGITSMANEAERIHSSEALTEKVKFILNKKPSHLLLGYVKDINDDGYELMVTDIIGDNEDENTVDEKIVEISKDKPILIRNFDSYECYDVRKPQIGDNVLMAILFNGNVSDINGGAFLVTGAYYHSARIMVPSDLTDEARAALTALYKYVKSDGKNCDFTIKGTKVYDGENREVNAPEAICITDEFGDVISETKADDAVGDGRKSFIRSEDKWICALAIIVLGSSFGVMVTMLIIKSEKRDNL